MGNMKNNYQRDIEIRQPSGLIKLMMAMSLIFFVFAAFSIYISLINLGGSFKNPLGSALLFGGFWGSIFILSSVYTIKLHNERWVLKSDGILIKSFTKLSIKWEDIIIVNIEKEYESKYFSIKIQTKNRTLNIFPDNFQADSPDSANCILSFFKSKIPQDKLIIDESPDFKKQNRKIVIQICSIFLFAFFQGLLMKFCDFKIIKDFIKGLFI